MKKFTLVQLVPFLHIATAMGIGLFWFGFYCGIIFPVDVLSPKISDFNGYYAWETSFTIPDLILALVMITGGVRLFIDGDDRHGKTLLIAASGACIFLGLLDFVYDFNNGMYSLGHVFSYVLLVIGTYLPVFGVFSIYVLHKD